MGDVPVIFQRCEHHCEVLGELSSREQLGPGAGAQGPLPGRASLLSLVAQAHAPLPEQTFQRIGWHFQHQNAKLESLGTSPHSLLHPLCLRVISKACQKGRGGEGPQNQEVPVGPPNVNYLPNTFWLLNNELLSIAPREGGDRNRTLGGG